MDLSMRWLSDYVDIGDMSIKEFIVKKGKKTFIKVIVE